MATGAVGQHLVSKALDYPSEREQAKAEAARDEKIDEINKNLVDVKKSMADMANKSQGDIVIHTKDSKILTKMLEDGKEKGSRVANSLEEWNGAVSRQNPEELKKAHENLNREVKDFASASDSIKDFWGKVTKPGSGSGSGSGSASDQGLNGFQPLDSISDLLRKLDEMTLLEESSIFQILLLSTLLLTVLHIIGILLSKEITVYFKLEAKFPRLLVFFKLREKFQKYYLIANLGLLILLCLGGLAVNVLMLYCIT